MCKTKIEIIQNHKKYAKKQTLKKKTYYEIHTLNYQSLIVISQKKVQKKKKKHA